MLARRVFFQSRLIKFTPHLSSFTPLKIQCRTVRFKANNQQSDEKEGVKKEENKAESDNDEKKTEVKLDPETVRKVRFFGLLTFLTSGFISFYLMKRFFSSPMASTGDPIPFTDFVDKFLKAGEVRSVIYSPSQGVAMVQLHEGAVIDGKPWPHSAVLVQYKDPTGEIGKFETEVRKVEDELNVRPQDRVTIAVLEGMNARKVIELIVALVILFFLFSQYGRLIRNRISQGNPKGH